MKHYNGMPATELRDAGWRKSSASNSQGACVELTKLGSDEFAVRNSRYPEGPALIYTHAEVAALIEASRWVSSTICSVKPLTEQRFPAPAAEAGAAGRKSWPPRSSRTRRPARLRAELRRIRAANPKPSC